jgi:hypothetical protein
LQVAKLNVNIKKPSTQKSLMFIFNFMFLQNYFN